MHSDRAEMPDDAGVSDACWRRIGVEGDRSCARLAEAVHCRNCPVFAAAGEQLFQREAPPEYLDESTRKLAEVEETAATETLALLLFRVGPEWLALDVRAIVEVVEPRAIHRVPHRTDRLLLGLANIRGELHLCLSLAELLGIDATAPDAAPASAPIAGPQRRLLVTEQGQYRWVFPVDEVEGACRVPANAMESLPHTVQRSPRYYSQALFSHGSKRVGMLSVARLFQALEGQRPMSPFGVDDSLIDLFREEVRTNCQVLTDGLVALEQGGASPQRLEAMMRAAHSIKGAARVVNVPPGVEVSHAMEDCFVRAQKAQLTLTGGIVDILLECVDLLQGVAEAAGAGLATWLEANRGRVAGLLQRLGSTVEQGQAEALPGPAAPVAGDRRGDDSASPPPAPAARAGDDARAEPIAPAADVAEAPAGEQSGVGAAPATQTDEGVVRVRARSLTRLMGLAGESLVESRWLPPFSKALLQLKHLYDQLADTLDGLGEAAQPPPAAERSAALLGDAPAARLAACRELLSDRIAEFDRRMRNNDDLSARLYREVISSRMRPFRDGVQGLPRLARDLARQLGKKVQLEVLGETTEVDRDILERLDAPLNHLVRNALDHALETPEQRQAAGKPEAGRLRIAASHSAGLLSITVADDGRGIDVERLRHKIVERGHATAEVAQRLTDAELLDFLFLPGFSTAAEVTEISGRGVGLDVVHTMVQSVGGRVYVHTEVGRGTSFQIQLPVTLSVLRAVVVDIAGEPYAFPHNRIDRVIRVARDELRSLENRQYVQVDGQNVGIVMGRQVLQLEGPEPAAEELLVVLFSERSASYGLVVDALLGEQDLVVRPLDRRLGKVPNLHAAAILDDGSPVLIVDVDDLRRSIEKLLHGSRLQRAGSGAALQAGRPRKRVLVVDDSITVREVERQLLANHGYLVEVAVDGMEGWNLVREGQFDLVISDIDMPRLNGLELVRRMKADVRLKTLPVVIVSYKDREEDRLRGLEAGANHYLAKSGFHDETLVQVVRELIGDAET